jgi:hypothetical protein
MDEVRENYDAEFDVDLSDVFGAAEGEADQPEQEAAADESTEEAAGGSGTEGQGAGAPEQTEQADQPDDVYHLKWLDEQKDVNREEVTQLAQKGLDYDRVKSKLEAQRAQTEQYKAFHDENEEAVRELQAFMEETGAKSVAEVLDGLRVGRKVSAGTARDVAVAQVAQERAERALKWNTAKRENAASKSQEKAAADVRAFIEAHPNEDLAKLLPELSEDLDKTQDLEKAYTAYSMRKLQKQVKELTDALAAEKQNKSNRQRSAGSARSAGGETVKDDPFLAVLMS